MKGSKVSNSSCYAISLNRAFIIAEEKSEAFRNLKRSIKLDEILERAKRIELKK